MNARAGFRKINEPHAEVKEAGTALRAAPGIRGLTIDDYYLTVQEANP